MKYLLVIFSLFAIFSGIALYIYYQTDETVLNDTIVMRINDRLISKNELVTRFAQNSHYTYDVNDFIQTLINKELFIQEAQKLKIDKEESFRRSIQNYYEQSLIKSLMDRKMESLNINVSDALVNRYGFLLNKRVAYTVWEIDSTNQNDIKNLGEGKSQESDFLDLSIELRRLIASLDEGDISKPDLVKSGFSRNVYVVVKLDRVLGEIEGHHQKVNKQRIKEQLIANQQERELSQWIEGLKKSAKIEFMIDLEDPQLMQELKKTISQKG